MSIFAKRISDEEICSIYNQIYSVADQIISLNNLYFYQLFNDYNEFDKSINFLIAEAHVYYALREAWFKNGDSTRTVLGRQVQIMELLTKIHELSYSAVSTLFKTVKEKIERDKKNYSAENALMGYADSFLDCTVTIAMQKKGLSLEDIGFDYIDTLRVSIAGAFRKR